MPRKVKKSDVEQWLKLREEGHTYKEIQKTTGWNAETIRKHCEEAITEKDKTKKEEAKRAKAEEEVDYAKIFSVFDESEDPTEVVKRGLCTPEQAKNALEDYLGLKDETTLGQLDDVELNISDLKEGQSALQYRIKKLENSITSSFNREWKCSKCGAKRYLAMPIRCTVCGYENWFGWYPPKTTQPPQRTTWNPPSLPRLPRQTVADIIRRSRTKGIRIR